MGDKERFGKLPETDQPKPRARTCANCTHFAEAVPGKLPPTCRKNVPTLVMSNGGMIGLWPGTEPHYWCGEHLLDAHHFE